jgi:hypothetical protein
VDTEVAGSSMKVDGRKALLGLPRVCLICGRDTGGACVRLVLRQFLYWADPKTRVVGLVPLDVPVCPAHRWRNTWINLLMWLSPVAAFAIWFGVAWLGVSLTAEEMPESRGLVAVGGLCGGFVLGMAALGVSLSFLAAFKINAAFTLEEDIFVGPSCPAFDEACRDRGYG